MEAYGILWSPPRSLMEPWGSLGLAAYLTAGGLEELTSLRAPRHFYGALGATERGAGEKHAESPAGGAHYSAREGDWHSSHYNAYYNAHDSAHDSAHYSAHLSVPICGLA